jgi:hypothetical protein
LPPKNFNQNKKIAQALDALDLVRNLRATNNMARRAGRV